MPTLHDFPFFALEFTKDGQPYQPGQANDLLAFLQQATASAAPVTDLLVLSHGWNNDKQEAQDRYDCLLKQLRVFAPTGRRFAAVGLFWPSKKFADRELIPGGGAASVGAAGGDAELRAELAKLRGAFDAPGADDKLARAEQLVPLLEYQQAARSEFADLMKDLLAAVPSSDGDPTGAASFQRADSARLLQEASEPLPADLLPAAADAAAGAAAGIGDFFGSIQDGARTLLNYTTYYQMKERAGLVGRQGLRPLLADLHDRFPQVKLHLVGHSFGGRLVTSAASGQTSFRVQTLTLLQTAFSHYGFSGNYDGQNGVGLFRPLITDQVVTGPVLISHAEADFAVSRMYALASRLAGQVAANIDLGGPNDKFGGLGRNGAQKTAEASFGALLAVPGSYTFQPGRLHNLHGNTVVNQKAIISGHGDICGPEIASAIMQAIATT